MEQAEGRVGRQEVYARQHKDAAFTLKPWLAEVVVGGVFIWGEEGLPMWDEQDLTHVSRSLLQLFCGK